MFVSVLIIPTILQGCEDQDGARKILVKKGYKYIHFEGDAPLLCGPNDDFSNRFVAIDKNGILVHGVVCQKMGGYFSIYEK